MTRAKNKKSCPSMRGGGPRVSKNRSRKRHASGITTSPDGIKVGGHTARRVFGDTWRLYWMDPGPNHLVFWGVTHLGAESAWGMIREDRIRNGLSDIGEWPG